MRDVEPCPVGQVLPDLFPEQKTAPEVGQVVFEGNVVAGEAVAGEVGEVLKEQVREDLEHRKAPKRPDGAPRQLGVAQTAPGAEHFQEDPARLFVAPVACARCEVELREDLDVCTEPRGEDADEVRCFQLYAAAPEAEHRTVVAVLVLLVASREGLEALPIPLAESEFVAVELLVFAKRDQLGHQSCFGSS